MSYVVTPDQMRAAEQQAVAQGVSEAGLMQAAATGIAKWLDDAIPAYGRERHVFALVGPGKNGADTVLALAELIDLEWTASAMLFDRSGLDDLAEANPQIGKIEIVADLTSAVNANVILDGVYGLGGRASLPDHVSDVFRQVSDIRRNEERIVVAIDVPSGVDCATGKASNDSLQCDATLSVGFLKTGLLMEPAASLTGDVTIIDIGLEAPDENQLQVTTPDMIFDLLPHRSATDGKHDHGGLLVIGGAPMYFGAPRLAVEAALKVGTGLVGAAVPRMIVSTIAAQVPEVVFLPLGDSDPSRSVKDLNKALSGEDARYTAAVLGPGLGRDEPAKALLTALFGQASTSSAAPIGFGAVRSHTTSSEGDMSALASVPVVIDADALNWLSEQTNWPALLENINAVLTPHAGEMARLLDITVEEVKADPRTCARDAARHWGQVVVLKGGYTSVAAADGRQSVAYRATPELATPGTGDVLAGVIGAFLAQGVEAYDAARLAVCIGARAGQYARQHRSARSVLARDLIEELGSVLYEVDSTPWWI
jgi:ADP-dependent NAD(P)H-hydrate dehydratase / NAD(P)H-hydrate epimerase